MRFKTNDHFLTVFISSQSGRWRGAQERLYCCDPKSDRELLVNYFGAILRIRWLGEFLTMLIAKVPAAIAAVLLMSSVSVQAMEFADRPGPISETFITALTVRAMQSEEGLRRHINDHNILLPTSVAWIKLADQPRPISNLTGVWMMQMTHQNRPGRLSAEFSAVAKSSRMKFEYGPGEVSNWLKPTATRIASRVSHYPGPIGNLFPPLAAEDINFADRGFTSSLTKDNIPSELEPGKGSAGFCVGSMAPCGSMDFAEIGSLSPAYNDERL
jgi:hypothetical protein